jgi:hypothetical protein
MFCKNLCVGLLLMIAPGLHAQIPGYLGKRFFLNAENWSMPALQNPTANNKGWGDNIYGSTGGGFAFNTTWSAQAGYAVSRTRVLSLSADYMRTGMILDLYTPSQSFFAQSGEQDYHYLFYNLKGPGLTLGWYSFNPNKGSLAPMGFYNGWSLRAQFIQGEILDKRTSYYYLEDGVKHAPLGVESSKLIGSLGWEFGYNTIYFDRMVFSLGCRLSIPLNVRQLSYIMSESTPEFESYEETNQAEFDKAVVSRMALHNLANLKIGVGYLIF